MNSMNSVSLPSCFSLQSASIKGREVSFFLEVGASLLFFPILTLTLSTAWLIAGGHIAPFAAWCTLLVSAAGALLLSRFLFGKNRTKSHILAPLVSILLGVLALVVAFSVHDTSIDGQHYHFQAIYALANGWNPYADTSMPPVIADPITIWAVHYPRGAWMFAANLLAAGAPLAMTKALNPILLFSAGAILLATLLRFGFSRPFAGLLSAAAIFNPIVLSQLLTNMNDGLLGICFLLFVASMSLAIVTLERGSAAIGVCALLLGANLKFSSIPILLLLGAFSCIAAGYLHGIRAAAGMALLLGCSFIFALIFLGWSPYVQNQIHFGHVFYPLMGPEAVDIMVGNVPELVNTPSVLEPLSPLNRFLYSLFAETHAGFESVAHLKIPFVVTPAELRAAGGVDVRIGGFGPLFSGAFVIAAFCAIALLANFARLNVAVSSFVVVAGIFMVSVVIMPQNWWARYVPQFWFVLLCIAAAAIATGRRPMQLAGGAILAVMLVNAAVAGGASVWLASRRSAEVDAQLAALAQVPQSYCIYPEMAQSRIFLMREAGINVHYREPSASQCETGQEIAGYGPDRTGGFICVCSL